MGVLASSRGVLTIGIVLGTCGLLAVPRIKGIALDRGLTALAGAVSVVLVGAISSQEAFAAVDATTVVLLFGMMVHVEGLATSGFYEWAGPALVNRAGTTRRLVLGTLWLAAGLSAVALNDATVLLLAPVLLGASEVADTDPTDPLIALVLGSNIGSLATPLGNPQNAYLLARSDLTTATFVATLAPVAIVCLVIAAGVVLLITANDRLGRVPRGSFDRRQAAMSGAFLLGTLVVLLVAPGANPGFVASATATVHLGALQLTRRVPAGEVIDRIDWGILVLFVGLFVLTGSLDGTMVPDALGRVSEGGGLAGATFVLSGVVSNVPAAVLLSAVVSGEKGWLTLAAVSTLAGNATPIASAATLIVLEAARRRGERVSIRRLVAVCLPVALVTTVVAVLVIG